MVEREKGKSLKPELNCNFIYKTSNLPITSSLLPSVEYSRNIIGHFEPQTMSNLFWRPSKLCHKIKFHSPLRIGSHFPSNAGKPHGCIKNDFHRTAGLYITADVGKTVGFWIVDLLIHEFGSQEEFSRTISPFP